MAGERRGRGRLAGSGGAPQATPVQARQGVTTGRVRWILAISLALIAVALFALWLWFVTARPSPPVRPHPATPVSPSGERALTGSGEAR
ncbi:MAG: hypothetical protein ACREEW_02160 [Caulobacteraceae bacterium]